MSLLLRSMTTDMAREDEVLFLKDDLHAVLQAHEAEMLSKIDSIDQNELLGIDIDQLCDYYEAEYRVDVPRLDESAVTVDQRETQIDVSQDQGRVIRDKSRPCYVTGTEVTFFVPFEGDAKLFYCAASTRSSLPLGRSSDRTNCSSWFVDATWMPGQPAPSWIDSSPASESILRGGANLGAGVQRRVDRLRVPVGQLVDRPRRDGRLPEGLHRGGLVGTAGLFQLLHERVSSGDEALGRLAMEASEPVVDPELAHRVSR